LFFPVVWASEPARRGRETKNQIHDMFCMMNW